MTKAASQSASPASAPDNHIRCEIPPAWLSQEEFNYAWFASFHAAGVPTETATEQVGLWLRCFGSHGVREQLSEARNRADHA